MKSAQLHPNIRYISLTDDDGDMGILIMHYGEKVLNAVEVSDRDAFASAYSSMRSLCS